MHLISCTETPNLDVDQLGSQLHTAALEYITARQGLAPQLLLYCEPKLGLYALRSPRRVYEYFSGLHLEIPSRHPSSPPTKTYGNPPFTCAEDLVCPVTSVKIVMDAFARLLDLNARNYDIKCWAEMKAPVGCALSSCILSTHSGVAFGWSLPLILHLGLAARFPPRHAAAPGRVRLRTAPIQARLDSIRYLVLL
jgi:hypothetical protein